MLPSLIWILIAGMVLVVLQKLKTMADCEMIIILYPVLWLIFFYLEIHMMFPFICIIVGGRLLEAFKRSDFVVCLWKDNYHIPSSLIDSLLALIFILFLFIWIILARMFVAVLQNVIPLYDCKIVLILYPVYLLILYMLLSVLCLFFYLNYWSGYVIEIFTTGNYLVWLWMYYYFVSSSLFDYLLLRYIYIYIYIYVLFNLNYCR